MADEEQIAILRQGSVAWNAWRMEHLSNVIDLAGANLIGANLRRADLREANLREANLQGANLAGANLREANLAGANLYGAYLYRAYLYGADLTGVILQDVYLQEAKLTGADFTGANLERANLERADLTGANFQEANLLGADLIGADLIGADFKRANLERADLTGANLERANLYGANLRRVNLIGAAMQASIIAETVFVDVDLRGVQGLDKIKHRGPSSIGIDTLYRSRGDIPDVFLRGCGVPDPMIEYARSLVLATRPIDYYSVFISYSSYDEAVAKRLHADLQARGVRCWFAPHDLEIGAPIVRGIDEAIRIYDKLLIILSEAAVTSRWVDFEVSTALHREVEQGRTMLFPIRLDDAVLYTPSGWAIQLRTRHIGDFRGWRDHDYYQEAFTRLLRDLVTNRSVKG